jgi:type I restriction-modification system DNA methylase subunit
LKKQSNYGLKQRRFDDLQMSREVQFQQEFYYLLKKIVGSRPEVDGFKFSKVEMEHPVGEGRADIVVFDEAGKAFIVIETKRKDGRVSRNIDPLSFRVISQALGYAGFLGASFIVTANIAFLASFIKPLRDEPFSIERHRVLITPIQILNEAFVLHFLETIVKYHHAVTVEERAKLATGLDWTFILRLRSFVMWLATEVDPVIKSRLRLDEKFRHRVREFEQEKAVKFTSRTLAEQMSYILTNKIVFYKVLERTYPQLPKLSAIKVPRPRFYLKALYRLFETAIRVTKDFEAVFSTGLFDEIVLPEQSHTLLDVLQELAIFVKDMETYPLEKLDADVIGHVYEELLQPEERHRLGQFYTPPPIAELICKWAIRQARDSVLDPATGSGTFLVKSYQTLRELKKIDDPTESLDDIHGENVKQLYAIDINPFPAQIAAMNLAMRNVNHPISELNIVRDDFFKVMPNQDVFVPYAIRTAGRQQYRKIRIPEVDAVVANPPYTRWTELSKEMRGSINKTIGMQLSRLKMRAGATQSEPMIYLHFIIHSTQFLNKKARLGMIVSNSWLQADYGVRFGKYLLDNFRVVGVIDFSPRVFAIPMIATLVILMEREEDSARRDQNKAVFVFIDKSENLTPERILEAVERPSDVKDGLVVNSFEQKALRSDVKWINVLFGAEEILQKIKSAQGIVPAERLFTVATSNTGWAYWALQHGSRTNLGTKQFFYLTKDDVRVKGLEGYVSRALPSVRYAKFFSFGTDDWKALRKRDAPSYFFMCHKSKSEVPKSVADYIKWGESECRTGIRGTRGGGKICSKAYTCQEREKARQRFSGWYDLGGFKHTPIMAVYQSQYRPRFFWCKENLVTYQAIVTFLPRADLTDEELKATLAYLNSNFCHLYVEAEGRATALGLIALEVAQAERMPTLDIKTLSRKNIRDLANLFDRLEEEARKIGGAHTMSNLGRLEPLFEEIDNKVVEVLDLPESLGKQAREVASRLMARRLIRTEQAVPEILRGEEQGLEMRPPARKIRVKRDESDTSMSLDQWTKPSAPENEKH